MIFCVAACNGNVHKSRAIREGRLANVLHAVADCHARKPGATTEGRGSNARHAVGDCYARKTCAPREGIIAYACHAVIRRNDACFTTQE